MTADILTLRQIASRARRCTETPPWALSVPGEAFPVSGARPTRTGGDESGIRAPAAVIGLNGELLVPGAWPPRLPDDVVEFVALPNALVWRRRGEDAGGFLAQVNAAAKVAGLETVRVWKSCL